MRLVVADTSPVFYLLKGRTNRIAAAVFGKVFIPAEVHNELTHPAALPVLREWVAECPSWIEVMPVDAISDPLLRALGAGERAAITLALSLHADLILIDERKATSVALTKGIDVTGTLGILRLAARVVWSISLMRSPKLTSTNFRYRREMIDDLLGEFSGGS